MVTDSGLPVPDDTPSLSYFPFSSSTPHGSTNMGGARHGSANQSPACDLYRAFLQSEAEL